MPAADPVLGLMDRFTAALNAHDLDAVLALVTDDVRGVDILRVRDGQLAESLAYVKG